jgi:predicted enzyme related to lactoylglutathione lyase
METVDVRGRFVWHQLLTRNVPGARKFYSKLVGWKTQPWPLDPGYTVCHAADVPTAGMMEMTAEVPAEAPPHWLQYIGTRDVDGTAEAAVRAGGSILKPPSDMKGAGRYAVLQDPHGAAFAIIDPENARPESAGLAPMASFSWHELATTDHEAAFAFYSGLFGWDAIMRMDMGPVGTYLIFGQDGVQKGGIYIKPPENPGPANWLPYARVPDVDAAARSAAADGATIMQAPMDVPGGGRICILKDPAGAAFALHSAAAEESAGSSAPAQRASKPSRTRNAKPKSSSKARSKLKAKAKSKPRSKKARSRMKATSRAAAPRRPAGTKLARGKKKASSGKPKPRKRPASNVRKKKSNRARSKK